MTLTEKSRKWRLKNPAKSREYSRKWALANPEKLRSVRQRSRSKLSTKLKAQTYRAERWAKHTEILTAIKMAKGCALCGYNSHAQALDFDHLDPHGKKFTIGQNKSANLEVLLAEVAKCRVLCANCHRVESSRDPRVRAKYATARKIETRPEPPTLPLFESETVN